MTRYAKALVALLTALSAWGTTAAVDGDFDAVELFGLPLVLVAGIGVFATPNRPPRGKRRRPDQSEQDPDAGHVDAVFVIVGTCVVALGLVLGTLLLRLA